MLDKLINDGVIYIDNDTQEYVGITPTGEVCLGIIGNEKTIEKYLEDYPTPDTW